MSKLRPALRPARRVARLHVPEHRLPHRRDVHRADHDAASRPRLLSPRTRGGGTRAVRDDVAVPQGHRHRPQLFQSPLTANPVRTVAHPSGMKAALALALTLSAGAARSERRWVVEPGQALITLDADAYSAFSSRLSGHLEERADGSIRLELRVPLRSFTSGDAGQDRNLPRDGEIVFLLTAPKPGKDAALDLDGTLVFGKIARQGRFRFKIGRASCR